MKRGKWIGAALAGLVLAVLACASGVLPIIEEKPAPEPAPEIVAAQPEPVEEKPFSTDGLEPGFTRVDGAFYYVQEDGTLLRESGCHTLGDTRVYCEGESAVLQILSHQVELSDGRRFLVEGGEIVRSMGLKDFYGNLYFLKPDFSLLCDGSWKGMRFGADGVYTCGNAEIDDFINAIVREVTEPSMNREEKLRACYEYVFEHTGYQSNNRHVARGAAASSWTEESMLRLIERGKGNCYCYAAEMYYLAKRVGYYNARAISGGVMLDNDHGWLEIEVNGEPTVTDPELESKNFSTSGHIFLTPYDDTPWDYFVD